MTRREKILAGALGSVVVVVLVLLLVKKAYLDPLDKWRDQRISWSNSQKKLQRKNARTVGRASDLRGLAARTFDNDELRASAKLAATLLELVERAGLSPEKLSVQPVRGSQVKNVYRELGRVIRVRGKLDNIIDFLYLLDAEPHLHRLDQLTITPVLKANEVDLQVRYVTPVIDLKDGKIPTDKIAASMPAGLLDSPGRKLFKTIAARDLLRPYIKRPAVPTPPPATVATRQARPSRPTPTPASPSSRYKVVGLPDWSDSQEVLVSDSVSRQVRSYKPGDTLGGGTIAMVDYRPMPSRANPLILSPCRVILKVGPEYFAVELGEELTDKRRMSSDKLPEQIHPPTPSVPTENADENAAADPEENPPAADSVKKTAPAER